MKICAVTVTYGNRADNCLKISDQILSSGVDELIIVNNGSIPESVEKLAVYSNLHTAVRLINLETNMGSARGFGEGISAFLAGPSDVVFLLDDDNFLANGALDGLIRIWKKLDGPDKEENTALSSFRADRPNMIAALQTGESKFILPAKNSFMGFHIRLLWNFIQQRLSKREVKNYPVRALLEIPATTYGGLWMHRKLCIRVGLPNPEYILYMDDFDFTKRITDLGGRIILVRDSKIHDLQESYYLPAKKKWLYHSLLYASSDAITYYTCRNIIFFGRQYGIINPFIYQLNRFLYFIAVFFLALLNGKMKKLSVIYAAIKDGETGAMGLSKDFQL